MSKLLNLIFMILIAIGFSGCISISMDIGGKKDKQQPVYYSPPPPPMPYYY